MVANLTIGTITTNRVIKATLTMRVLRTQVDFIFFSFWGTRLPVQ
jgi:hypothetical protein